MTCVSLFIEQRKFVRCLEVSERHDTCDICFCLIALISRFHILYKVVGHDQKESYAQMWYLAPTSASAYVLLLELHSYAHDAMLERRNNFIMFLHLECLLLGRVFTIGLLGNLEALLQ